MKRLDKMSKVELPPPDLLAWPGDVVWKDPGTAVALLALFWL